MAALLPFINLGPHGEPSKVNVMPGTSHPLSDAASAFLVEHYRTHAEVCRQMALATVDLKEGWLQFAQEWTKLARETEANVG